MSERANTPNMAMANNNGIPKWALPVVLLCAAVLYSRALTCGLTSFDDDTYIAHNPFLKDCSIHGIKAIFTSFYACNYYPLTTLTFLAEYTAFGLNPLTYHLVNVLLHLVNIVLVFKLVDALSGKSRVGLLVCILFAVHPFRVESVAWVSERKDVLYALFYISSLIVYLRYINTGQKARHYIWTLSLFVLSLLSKPAAVSLPVLLLVIDLYKGRKLTPKVWLEKMPFLLLSLVFGVINIMAQQADGAISDLNAIYNPLQRVVVFCSAPAFYIVSLVAPFRMTAVHFFPTAEEGALPVLYYLSIPFLAAVGWWVVRNKYLRKEVLFGVAFFLVSIAPMLQIISVGSAFAAERYTYVPYVGLFYIVAQWLADPGSKQRLKMTVFFVFTGLFVVLGWMRIAVWKSDETLYGDIIEKDAKHAAMMAQGSLEVGLQKAEKGDMQKALEEVSHAVLMDPASAQAYYSRGVIYAEIKDYTAAVADFSKVIELSPENGAVYSARANVQLLQKDTAHACADWNKAALLGDKDAERKKAAFCH